MLLDEAVTGFLSHCRYGKNLSPRTLRAYSIDLRQLSAHLRDKLGITSILAVDKAALRDYIQSLFGANAEKTVKRKVATLKAFFHYLEREDIILANPVRKMEVRIRETKRLPRTMPFPELKRLFRHLYEQKEACRDRSTSRYTTLVRDVAVLELLFATGARVSEVCQLKRDDVDLRKGAVRILGKGARERIIQLCDPEMLAALRDHASLQKEKNGNGHFFHNRLGRRFSEQSVRAMLKRHAGEAGVTAKITPHRVRHSVATLLLEEGVDIRHIQHLLGHSSIVTTQIYTHVEDRSHRQVLARRHPRRRFRVNQELTSASADN